MKWATEDSIARGLDARDSLKQILKRMRFLAAEMHQRGFIDDEELRNFEEDWLAVRQFVYEQLEKERAKRGELG